MTTELIPHPEWHESRGWTFNQQNRVRKDAEMRLTPKILILGGGFAGVEVARELEKRLTPDEAILQLVSRDNFVLFTPMLHEIAASDLDISAIANPIRKMIRRTEFIVADVENIDTDNKSVKVMHGFDRRSHSLTYDHLVLALGRSPIFLAWQAWKTRSHDEIT